MSDPGAVLDFWFKEHGPANWFAKDDAFDALIRDRFAATLERAARGRHDGWMDDGPRGGLALIVVLDQFSRNLYRDDARAFANDGKALALAKRMVDEGGDAELSADERPFVYLPFEHSESIEDQVRCIDLFTALGRPDLLEWAKKHKVIIDRFGRFPHRNAALGRESTPEEIAFLAEPGSSF